MRPPRRSDDVDVAPTGVRRRSGERVGCANPIPSANPQVSERGPSLRTPQARGYRSGLRTPRGRWWYANCAWDAFGICGALHVDGRIEASCPDCGEPIAVEVRDEQPDGESLLFHCLVPVEQVGRGSPMLPSHEEWRASQFRSAERLAVATHTEVSAAP